ncbi:hypothetical protein PHAVU_008G032800 [Phaseolus vulgaris]
MSLKWMVELSIPDIIHNHGQPITFQKLVSILQVSPTKVRGVQSLIHYLAHTGFFEIVSVHENMEEKEAYALTAASQLLVKDSDLCLAPTVEGFVDPGLTGVWSNLKKWTYEDDLTLFGVSVGSNLWEFLDKNPASDEAFNETLAADSKMMNMALKGCNWVFEGVESIVDVGGGTGITAKILCEAFPNMKCIVLERPGVIENLSGTNNLTYVGGDMFKSIPKADAVLLKSQVAFAHSLYFVAKLFLLFASFCTSHHILTVSSSSQSHPSPRPPHSQMALQTATPPTTPSAQVVGNAFVEQYYHILHHSPDLVYRFYQDSSVISRPDSNGVMTSVTTMKGINEKIVSLNFKEFKAEIKTADAQKSYQEGVTVLVTGCLTGKDNMRRKFAQSFFLAPQDNGYFVLNDVFRYVEDDEPSELPPVNGDGDAAAVKIIPEPESSHVADSPAPDSTNSIVNKGQIVVEKAYAPSNHHERQIPAENEDNVESHFQSNGNDDSQATEVDSLAQEDAPKQSYASIVKVQKGSSVPTKVYVPTNTLKSGSNKTESLVAEPVESSEVPEAASDSVNDPESSDAHEEVEGHSIYIRNLPLNVTVGQLEVEFKKFGSIKPDGIQVRNNKQQGYCFGFVEFLSLNSMNSAIQASPIPIGGRQAVVEIKRTTTRVGSGISNTGRPRIPPGRGGLRNDSFRGRGNYGGGRGYGRNDYGNRGGEFSGRGRSHGDGEFSGRGRSHGDGEFSGRGRSHGESYHQGRGRGGRSSGPKQNAVVSN